MNLKVKRFEICGTKLEHGGISSGGVRAEWLDKPVLCVHYPKALAFVWPWDEEGPNS